MNSLKAGFFGLSDNIKGAAILILSAGLFSIMATLIKVLGNDFNIFQILFARQFVMLAIVSPSIARGFPDILRTRHPYLQMTRIILALSGMLLVFSSIIYLPLAEATALGFAKSFFVTIFAIVFLKETVGIRRWFAVALGFIGVATMLRPGLNTFTIYGFMAIAGAACAGAVMVIIRLMARHDKPTTILSWQAIGVGTVVTIPAIYYWTWPTPVEWALLVGLGLASYGAQMTNIVAYRWGEASLLASLDYIRLLYATLLGWLLFSTLPNQSTWIGAGVIIFASVYTIIREHRLRQELTRSPVGRGLSD